MSCSWLHRSREDHALRTADARLATQTSSHLPSTVICLAPQRRRRRRRRRRQPSTAEAAGPWRHGRHGCLWLVAATARKLAGRGIVRTLRDTAPSPGRQLPRQRPRRRAAAPRRGACAAEGDAQPPPPQTQPTAPSCLTRGRRVTAAPTAFVAAAAPLERGAVGGVIEMSEAAVMMERKAGGGERVTETGSGAHHRWAVVF